MAGEWIKMRHDLTDDPTVSRIARAFSVDRYSIVGRLHAFWTWADKHAVEGCVDGAASTDIDDLVRLPGFAAALVGVGWLIVHDNGGIEIPNFDRHSGESAKERGLKNGRQARWRAKKAAEKAAQALLDLGGGATPTKAPRVDASPSTAPPTRVEKKRVKETPPNPRKRGQAGTEEGFEDFWLAWPKSERKQDKAKCLEHWKRNNLAALAQAIVADIRVKRGTRKWAEGYDEAPLTYLRGKRWEDGVEPSTTGVAETGEWFETRKGCEKRALELGLDKWTETEAFEVYRARVELADKHARVPT